LRILLVFTVFLAMFSELDCLFLGVISHEAIRKRWGRFGHHSHDLQASMVGCVGAIVALGFDFNDSVSQTTLNPGLLCPPPRVFSAFLWFFDVLVEITTKPHHPGCGLRSKYNVGPAGMPRAATKAARFAWVPVAGREWAKESPRTEIPTGTRFSGSAGGHLIGLNIAQYHVTRARRLRA